MAKDAGAKKLKVVVYAIARDEGKFVDRWMASMKEADAVVAVDTGSTDGTPERLRALGAAVKQNRYAPWNTLAEYRAAKSRHETVLGAPAPWRFDWARNDSLEYAMRLHPDADILVCTDLDEFFTEGWRAKLEKAWADFAECNHSRLHPTTAQYEYIWAFNKDGTPRSRFWYEKIHAPGSAMWAHPVHEVLDYGGKEKRVVRVEGMRLEHHADPSKSRGQYLRMLEMSVAEDPDDDRNAHYLGREYYFARRWDAAIKTLKHHLSMPRAKWRAERAASLMYIARAYGEKGDLARKEAYLWRACHEEPSQREAALELAEMAYAQKDWQLLVAACERCLAVKEMKMSYLTQARAWGARPWDLYSVGLWYSGRREEALEANAEAMRLDPKDTRLKENDAVMRRAMEKGKGKGPAK